MSETPDIAPESGAARLIEALIEFAHCIGGNLDDLCSYSLTYGDTYVPFLPDEDSDDACDEDDTLCSQAWVRVSSINPSAGTAEGWGGDCAIELAVNLEVGVVRCVGIPEGGEAPTESDALAAAIQSLEDMNAMHCAAMNCEVWESIETGAWEPQGPMGGQYGGIWNFTVVI